MLSAGGYWRRAMYSAHFDPKSTRDPTAGGERNRRTVQARLRSPKPGVSPRLSHHQHHHLGSVTTTPQRPHLPTPRVCPVDGAAHADRGGAHAPVERRARALPGTAWDRWLDAEAEVCHLQPLPIRDRATSDEPRVAVTVFRLTQDLRCLRTARTPCFRGRGLIT